MAEAKKKVKRKVPKYLSEEEIKRLRDIPFQDEIAAKKKLREARKEGSLWTKRLRNKLFNARRDQAILALLYSSGIRVAEMIGIDINDLNLKGNVVTVLGKGGNERQGSLTRKTVNILNKYLKARRFWKGNRTEALFLNRTGERLQVRDFQRKIEGYGKRAGIVRKVTPHQIRHSFATHLIDKGMDISRIQKELGHKRLSSTEIYTFIRTKKQREEFEKYHPDYD